MKMLKICHAMYISVCLAVQVHPSSTAIKAGKPGVTSISSTQRNLPPGMSTPRQPVVPKLSTPKITLPALLHTSKKPQVTAALQKAKYDCPKECNYCLSLRDKGICKAFDDYGRIKSAFLAKLPKVLSDAYEYTDNMKTFRVNGELSTCEGMMLHLRLWAALRQRTRNNIKKFLNDPTSITIKQMEEFPKHIYAILDKRLEKMLYGNMSDAQKSVVCSNLQGDSCLVKSAIMEQVDCPKVLLKNGKPLDPKDAAALLDTGNLTAWDDETWNFTIRNCPSVLRSSQIERCPTDILVDNMDKLFNFCSSFDKSVIEKIASKTTEKMKDLKRHNYSIPSDTKSNWIAMMSKCGADPDYFDGVLSISETLKSVDMSKANKRKAMKFMEEKMRNVDISALNKDEIANSAKILAVNKTLLYELNTTQLEEASCDICTKADDLDSSDLRTFSKVVTDKVPKFKDPSGFTATSIECISCMMPYFPKQFFENIPSNVRRTAIVTGKVKVALKTRTMGRTMLEDAKTAFNKPNGDYNRDELKKIGSLVVAMKASELKNIPDDSFNDTSVLENIESAFKEGKMEVSKAVRSKFVEKVTNGAGIGKAFTTSLAKDIPISYLENAAADEFDDLTGESTESKITCSRKQAAVLMKKVKRVIGDVSDSNTNYTLKRITNIIPYVCGMTKDDLNNLNKDNTFLDKISIISESPCLSRGLTVKLYKLRKEYMKFDTKDSSTIQTETSSSTIAKLSPQILAQHSKSELEKYGKANCKDLVDVLSSANQDFLTKKQLKEKFEFYLECVGKKTGDLTMDDLTTAGNLVCGMSSADIKRMNNDAIDEFSSKLEVCPQSEEEKGALGKKIISSTGKTDGSSFSSSDIIKMGSLIGELSDKQLDDISDDVISDLSETTMKTMKIKDESDTKRNNKGYKLEISYNDKSTNKRKRLRVFKRILKAKEIINVRSSNQGGASGRRKRSAGSLTCSDLQALGATGLSALTLTQINDLDDLEFIDCAETLGSVTDYSSDQETALLAVASRVTVWGDPSTWLSTSVYNAGVIVQAMTTTQIGTLNLDLDAVSRLGQFSGWETSKLKAVFDRWLSLQKSSDSSTIIASELSSLGHVTCGASTSHINGISPSVYKDSADSIGEVTSCEASQLQAFVALAKASSYGNDVTTWDSAVISSIGIVVGGLSASEISSLSETQINSIDANHISYIPATAFTGFSVNQIYTFDATQAQATTSSQRSALSSSQLDALSTVATTTFSNPTDGASMIKSPWLACLSFVMVAIFAAF